MPISRSLEHNFFKKWSPNMAYVLGFFAADGSMIRNNRGAHFIEFTTTDYIMVEMIKRVALSSHKVQNRKRRSKKHKMQYRIQIGSKRWFEDLSSLGFTQNKSKKLSLPKVPRQYLADFIRGYFDGDGCVYFKRLQFADRKNPRLILLTLFTSGCRPFLESLWGILKRRGIQGGSLKKKTRGFELVFSHKDSIALHQLMYHTGQVLEMWLPRKRRKLESAIQQLMRE